MDGFFFNAMNKPWYITGDEGCGQVSSKLCVWFQKREQIHILGATPTPLQKPLDPDFFNGVNNLWYITGDEGCRQASS